MIRPRTRSWKTRKQLTKEEFGIWRSTLDIRIECVPGCTGCDPLLKAVGAEEGSIDESGFPEIIGRMGDQQVEIKDSTCTVTQHAVPPEMALYELTPWEYESKNLQLFQLVTTTS